MTVANSKVCDRCAGAMVFDGRISLPPQTIYKCESCGNQKWEEEGAPPYQRRAIKPDQPQAQQQQQPQPKSEAQHEADETDDARRLHSGLRGGGEDK
jgi:hypothetical protein